MNDDLDSKMRRIKILAKLAARADARGDRKRASELVMKARTIWVSVERVNPLSGMKLFGFAMDEYDKELKRRKDRSNPLKGEIQNFWSKELKKKRLEQSEIGRRILKWGESRGLRTKNQIVNAFLEESRREGRDVTRQEVQKAIDTLHDRRRANVREVFREWLEAPTEYDAKAVLKRRFGRNPMSKVLHILSKDDSGDYRVVVKSNDFKQNRIYHTPDFDDAWGTANHILKSDSGIKDGRAKWATDKAAKMKLAKNPTRFAKLTAKLKRRGARSPRALAAWIGRKKYGKKTFQAMALAGRRRKGRIIRGHFGKKKYRLAANTREYPKGLTPWIIYGVVGYFAYKFWINKAAQTLSK